MMLSLLLQSAILSLFSLLLMFDIIHDVISVVTKCHTLSLLSISFFLVAVGVTNTLGRLLAGFLADLSCVNSLLLHNLALVLAGVACILNMFCTSFEVMSVFAAFFGLCIGKYTYIIIGKYA